MITTALAIVAVTASGTPVSGCICYLQSPSLPGGFLFAVTNLDGYALWPAVPMPFAGELQIAGAAQYYQQNVTVSGSNVTLRCGPSPANPQDVKLPAVVPFKQGSALPAPPSRDQLCGINTSLQGLTYETTQYGPIPAWWYAILNPADQAIAIEAHKAAGNTHISIGISEAYKEPGTLWPAALCEGYDFAYDLEAFRNVLRPVICAGLLIDLPLAGDGLSVNPDPQHGQYNDPVGNTYGYQWLMNNLARIIQGLQGDGSPEQDLTPYIIFRPGWDGVFYGWGVNGEVPDQQPDRVRKFGELFRSILPNGALAIEHTPGNIPCGEGGSDYAPGGLMTTYDTIMSEFNTVHENSCWQIVARMVPNYVRPSDQPTGDDPNPPFYLAPGNPRGRYFYVAFEPTIGGVYQWCRGQCTLADVNAVRAYLRGLGCVLTG